MSQRTETFEATLIQENTRIQGTVSFEEDRIVFFNNDTNLVMPFDWASVKCSVSEEKNSGNGLFKRVSAAYHMYDQYNHTIDFIDDMYTYEDSVEWIQDVLKENKKSGIERKKEEKRQEEIRKERERQEAEARRIEEERAERDRKKEEELQFERIRIENERQEFVKKQEALQNEKNRQEENFKTLEAEKEEIQRQRTLLEKERREIGYERNYIETEKANHAAEVERFEEEKAKAQQDYQNAKASNEESLRVIEAEKAELQKQREELKKERALLKKERQIIDNARNDLETEKTTQKSEIERLKQEHEEREQEYEKRLAQEKLSLEEERKKLDEIKKDIEQEKAQKEDNRKEELEKERLLLERERQEVEESRHLLEEEKAQYEAEVKRIQMESAEKEKELKQEKLLLEEERRKIEKIQQEFAQGEIDSASPINAQQESEDQENLQSDDINTQNDTTEEPEEIYDAPVFGIGNDLTGEESDRLKKILFQEHEIEEKEKKKLEEQRKQKEEEERAKRLEEEKRQEEFRLEAERIEQERLKAEAVRIEEEKEKKRQQEEEEQRRAQREIEKKLAREAIRNEWEKRRAERESRESEIDEFLDEALSDDEQAIIDKWESISVKDWHDDTINAEVLVCKVMPDGTRRCLIHNRDFIKKQIKYKHEYGHYGYFCPDCMSLYVENSNIDSIIQKLADRNIEAFIQPVSETIEEWNTMADPIEIGDETTIFVPSVWNDIEMKCPEDGGSLIYDVYKKTNKDRKVLFGAFRCEECNKLLLRSSLADRLRIDLVNNNLPPIKFRETAPKELKKTNKTIKHKPNGLIKHGRLTSQDLDKVKWIEISDEDTIVVSKNSKCSIKGHETKDKYVLVKLDGKSTGISRYLVMAGYCETCGKYYVSKKDYDYLYEKGRIEALVLNDTDTDYYIQSGPVYEEEKKHLSDFEERIDSAIEFIRNDESYVSQYAVVSGGYDEGNLAFKKGNSRSLQKRINDLSSYIDNPYGYRVDLYDGKESYVYYIGASDFEIGDFSIRSFNSDWGREMVNYRTTEIRTGKKIYKVKRRRQFDISKAVLYGYIEQTDEDAIFRKGLTDPYLVKVLNTRKKQHQLTDIMLTIQENQNAIIDVPIDENIIVQGCAGSGKTVVMLQRLSALKYGNPAYDFDRVIILTPNDNFDTHIKGLASSLQLGYVDRLPVERYYESLLIKYSTDFISKQKISDEITIDQRFVDYMYSDEFLGKFWQALEEKTEEFGMLFDDVLVLSKYIFDEATIEQYTSKDENLVIVGLSLINAINERIKNTGYNNIEDAYKHISRIKRVIDNKSIELLDKIDNFNIKTLYDQTYEAAIEKSTHELAGVKNITRIIKNTYRFDLYLQLLFAQRVYGYNAGTNTLICIDEGQDLSPNEYRLIYTINSNPTINVYGDTNQLLKMNRGISDWSVVEETFGHSKRYVLNENFRNTNQITQFCNESLNMNVINTGVDGQKVVELLRDNLEKDIKRVKITEDRLAILIPRYVKKKEYLNSDELPVKIKDIIGEKIGNGLICLAYVDEVKGIEFEKVFVVVNGMSNNEKYIAYTRALSELTIIYDDDLEKRIQSKKAQKEIEYTDENSDSVSGQKDIDALSAPTSNVKYGRIRNNRKKAKEYKRVTIGYRFSCDICNKLYELSQSEVDALHKNNESLPTVCPECRKKNGDSSSEDLIYVGKCKSCKKPIKIRTSEYERRRRRGNDIYLCDDCQRDVQQKKALNINKEKKYNWTSELSRCMTADLFEKSYKMFIEQAEKNAISKKSNGDKLPFGITKEINERIKKIDGGGTFGMGQHFGQGAASKTPYINWFVVSIYYLPDTESVVVGIEKDRYSKIKKMEPIGYSQLGKKKTDVAVFFESRKAELDYEDLYSSFIGISEQVMKLEGWK